jgi:hypothetical protein
MTTLNSSSPRVAGMAARRQSWRELPVRVWMLITAVVLVVVLVVGARNVSEAFTDRHLVNNGIATEATIDLIYGASKMVDRSVQRDLNISYLVPGESERRIVEHAKLTPVYAAGMPGEAERPKGALLTPQMKFMNPGDRIPIRLDPKNPRRWTDRVNPASWLQTLAVPLLLLPIVFVLGLLVAVQRRATLRIFERGVAARANVVEATKSALTPGQHVLKLSIVGGDGRVFTATWPAAIGAPPGRGTQIDVYIDNASKPGRVVAAQAYTDATATA